MRHVGRVSMVLWCVVSVACARATLRDQDAGFDLLGSGAAADGQDGQGGGQGDDGVDPGPDGSAPSGDGSGDAEPSGPDSGDGDGEPATGDGDDAGGSAPPAEAPTGILFSEVMPRPTGSSDAEWIELYNGSGEDLDLAGCTVANDSGLLAESFVIDASLVIPKHGFVVLAREDAQNQSGITPSYVYGTFAMNSSETLRLSCAGALVDEITFADSDYQASLQLDQRYLEAGQNDDAATWCLGTNALPLGDDLGTPGAANAECASVSAP